MQYIEMPCYTLQCAIPHEGCLKDLCVQAHIQAALNTAPAVATEELEDAFKSPVST